MFFSTEGPNWFLNRQSAPFKNWSCNDQLSNLKASLLSIAASNYDVRYQGYRSRVRFDQVHGRGHERQIVSGLSVSEASQNGLWQEAPHELEVYGDPIAHIFQVFSYNFG